MTLFHEFLQFPNKLYYVMTYESVLKLSADLYEHHAAPATAGLETPGCWGRAVTSASANTPTSFLSPFSQPHFILKANL